MNREDALKFLLDECVFADSLSASGAGNLWLEHRNKVEALPADESGPAEILPMSEADVKAARRFRARHPREHSIIDIVRLNPMELLVHQHWISPSLAEPYAACATPAKWNQTALLDPPARPPASPRREGNTIVYDLPHPEFLLTDRPGAEPMLQLTEPRAFVTVAFHAGRALLLTGYHRTFALARRMMAQPDAPRGVLFAVSNALEMLGSDADEVKAAMESARPPRMADFFDPDLYLSAEMRKRRYQMRVNYEVLHLDAALDDAGPAPAESAVVEPAQNRSPAARLHATFEGAVRLQRNRRFEEAIQSYVEILRTQPNNGNVHVNLASALMETGRLPEAKGHAERAVWLDPGNADAQCNLGAVLRAEGSIDAGKRHCRQALAIDREHTAAWLNLGHLHSLAGEFDDALSSFRKVLALDANSTEAWLRISEIKSFSRSDPDLEALERMASGRRLAGQDAVFLHFALAKALEDCAYFDRAFEHFRIGSEYQKRIIAFDEQNNIDLFRAVTRSFSRDTIERLAGRGNPARVPVFVIGMPRSGTTLIEQILASHRHVYGAGELESLQDLLRTSLNLCDPPAVAGLDTTKILQLADAYLKSLPSRPDKGKIVDKMPSNFVFAGLIHLMFPNAKIIHAVRDPLDTCVSCYAKVFDRGQSFSYDLAELGRHYTRYQHLMNHWRSVLPAGCILDIRYEDLVRDFEPQVKRLLDFCDLDWDENCRTFYRTSRPVSTSSLSQVRQPLYDASIGRWRRFEKHLAPLLAELKPETADGVSLVA
jgi:tetratricopeptide (TPR) repeat protein